MTQTSKLTVAAACLALYACASAAVHHPPQVPIRAADICAAVTKANSDVAVDTATLTTDSADVCAGGSLRCLSTIRLNKGRAKFSPSAPPIRSVATPYGSYGPSDIRAAYNVPTQQADAKIAIVGAYDDPTAESDLNVYRCTFGMAPCTSDSDSGLPCFQKVNALGQTKDYPADPPAQDDWTEEISMDLEAASAICPSCRLLLVEAADDTGNSDGGSGGSLFQAIKTAAQMGATVISNSWLATWWASGETPGEIAIDAAYMPAGVGIFFAGGDHGYPSGYPATSPLVWAVGGTTLKRDRSARGWSETVWSDEQGRATGSACSAYEPQPTWQKQLDTGCAMRVANDVAADANDDPGFAVFDTADGNGGWMVMGGTSLATPIVAAIAALTGNGAAGPEYAYEHSGDFYDVTDGGTSGCPDSMSSVCNAGVGYDGPTGYGTPNAAAMNAGSSPRSVSAPAASAR